MSNTWSQEQQAVVNEFEAGEGHAVVVARAGTGKTTVIMGSPERGLRGGVEVAPETDIMVCAFSKPIADELTKRVGHLKGKVTAKTLHAIGFGVVKRYWPDVNVEDVKKVDIIRERWLAKQVCGPTAPDDIQKLVAKLCTKGREIAPHAMQLGDLTDIALTFECEPNEDWANDGFDLDYVESKALAAMELATQKPLAGIDFADMIFLPVRNRWLRKVRQAVVVDEAQDMTTAQLEIAEGICRGRIIVVGDNRQAIFAFRGADSTSLERLKQKLNAREFPLTTTYRCGKAIVAEAQRLVPDFQAGAGNPEGSVDFDFPKEKLVQMAGPGDFILSRINAPLVSVAMKLLRAGKRTRVAGKEIGKGLITLINKMRARSVPDLLRKIDSWRTRESDRLRAQFASRMDSPAYQARLEGIQDQAEMLASLTEGAPNVEEVISRITALFTDTAGLGVITCSSIHKAKGLEADRVFVLASTLRVGQNIEEDNLAYVAITRAKRELFYVNDGSVEV